MLVKVNGVDITQHINSTSYKIQSDDIFTEWKDGNYRTHRTIIRQQVKGSFEVALYGKDGMDTASFLDLWNGAVNNGRVLLTLFVPNLNTMKMIEAYYSIGSKKHSIADSGTVVDVFTIKLEEA